MLIRSWSDALALLLAYVGVRMLFAGSPFDVVGLLSGAVMFAVVFGLYERMAPSDQRSWLAFGAIGVACCVPVLVSAEVAIPPWQVEFANARWWAAAALAAAMAIGSDLGRLRLVSSPELG